MAITINQQPDSFSPAYNPNVFVVTSTNTGETNFQFVFDVYLNGSFATRHKIPVHPTTGKGIFDAARILEANLTHDINSSTTTWATNDNSFIKYQIKVGEQYDVTGTTTLFSNLATSNTIYAYNSVFDYLDFVDYSSSDYLISGTSSKFLTHAPSSQNVRTDDRKWLYMIVSTPSTADSLKVVRYNSSGGVIGTTYITNSYTITTDVNRFLRVGVGPWNLLQSQGSTFLDNVSYYTVTVCNNVPSAVSETRTFVLDSTCTKYTIYKLHFLNKLGGFDSFNFTLVSKINSNIDRTKYSRRTGAASGSSFTYDASDRSEYSSNIEIDKTIAITSDWITDSQALWMEELLTSPIVFHEISGKMVPISITDNKYEQKQKVNEKVINISISFNYSIKNYRQSY